MKTIGLLQDFIALFPREYRVAEAGYDGEIGIYNENTRMVAEMDSDGTIYFNYGVDLVCCRKDIPTPANLTGDHWVCARPLDHQGECGIPDAYMQRWRR